MTASARSTPFICLCFCALVKAFPFCFFIMPEFRRSVSTDSLDTGVSSARGSDFSDLSTSRLGEACRLAARDRTDWSVVFVS